MDHGIKVSRDQEAEKCRKLGNYDPCSKLDPRYTSPMLTWDNLGSILSMNQQNKLFGPPQPPMLLEQLVARISSETRLFVFQGTREILNAPPSWDLASMEAMMKRYQSRLCTNKVDEYKWQAQTQFNTDWSTWVPGLLGETGNYELKEP
jgi:hypothetical protein